MEVNDKLQKGYVYFRTKSMGRAVRPGFTPELTPKQMLKLGVFGGKYMTDCWKEFPASWFKPAFLISSDVSSLNASLDADAFLNKIHVCIQLLTKRKPIPPPVRRRS